MPICHAGRAELSYLEHLVMFDKFLGDFPDVLVQYFGGGL